MRLAGALSVGPLFIQSMNLGRSRTHGVLQLAVEEIVFAVN